MKIRKRINLFLSIKRSEILIKNREDQIERLNRQLEIFTELRFSLDHKPKFTKGDAVLVMAKMRVDQLPVGMTDVKATIEGTPEIRIGLYERYSMPVEMVAMYYYPVYIEDENGFRNSASVNESMIKLTTANN